jgi:hypothetical protein
MLNNSINYITKNQPEPYGGKIFYLTPLKLLTDENINNKEISLIRPYKSKLYFNN